MRTDDFWQLIDQARGSRASGPGNGTPAGSPDGGTVAERATDLLADWEAAEIVGFDRHLRRVLAASHREDLWGAAYLINGGCSEEGFDHFRGWLMTQGRAAFARAVTEPDALAELPEIRRAASTGEEFGSAELLAAPAEAYRRVTGTELPADPTPIPATDLGDFWDFDDEEQAQQRLPRLSALFLEPPPEH